MADISFYNSWDDTDISASGFGFYGTSGFGTSVAVGAYQNSTFVTNSGGTVQGSRANNIKWTHANSGSVNGAPSLNLLNIPNYQSSLNIRFTHSTAVRVENAKLRIYDRVSINNGASNVLTQVAELIHPDPLEIVTGSGDSAWIQPSGSGVTVTLANSPGSGGAYALNGASSTHSGTRHDWYVAMSASPNTIGSKYFAAYVEMEYF